MCVVDGVADDVSISFEDVQTELETIWMLPMQPLWISSTTREPPTTPTLCVSVVAELRCDV